MFSSGRLIAFFHFLKNEFFTLYRRCTFSARSQRVFSWQRVCCVAITVIPVSPGRSDGNDSRGLERNASQSESRRADRVLVRSFAARFFAGQSSLRLLC